MTTSITRQTLVSALQSMLPNFKIAPDWTGDPGGDLGYPIINDLGRYMCQQAGYGDDEEVARGLDFLEACLKDGDSYIQDLITECLETLSSCEYLPVILSRFGAKTRAVWEKLARGGI
jgi:hypothetical protein